MVNLFHHLVLLIYHNTLTNGLIIKGQRGTENIYSKVVLIGRCKYKNIEAGEKKINITETYSDPCQTSKMECLRK